MTAITVYGAGYVGSVTATCLASLGHNVLCMDVDEHKIMSLQKGESPIYEPGLDDMILASLNKNLRFTMDIREAAEFGDVQFIAVGTPSDHDGSADLRYVLKVAESIGQHRNQPVVIVNKSTVPVGTAHKVESAVEKSLNIRGLNVNFNVVSNPEFLREGSAIEDFMNADRVVVGSDSESAINKMREVYQPLINNGVPFIPMDVLSSEMTKYAANAFLATKISFINEISQLAEKEGADIEMIRKGIGMDHRIGPNFLRAGCGYGGSCFPKDVRALKNTAESAGCDSLILKAVESVNEFQKQWLFKAVSDHFFGNLEGKTVALWGLAFKPHTDDIREAPSMVLMEELWANGAKVKAFDPAANKHIKDVYPHEPSLELVSSPESAVKGADILVIVTEWPEFAKVDIDFVRDELSHPVIVDGRNMLDIAALAEKGVKYYSVGRNVIDFSQEKVTA